MNKLSEIAATLWIGGLWIVGLVVAPVLFRTVNAPTAGVAVGSIFVVLAWIGLVCGTLLLVQLVLQAGLQCFRTAAFWLVIGMLGCTLVNYLVVMPVLQELKQGMNQVAQGMFGGGFGTWHTLSSLIYLLQSILGLIYVCKKHA